METNHQRIDQFKQELADVNVKTPVDQGERTYLIAGMALAVVGLVVILIGWWGASGTAIVAEQIPYLISGGVLGLGLVVIGGALFVRYSLTRYLRFWVIRSIYEERAQADRQVEALERLEVALRETAGARGASAAAGVGGAGPVAAARQAHVADAGTGASTDPTAF
ncbi:MAG: hypothetical protein R2726_16825 [Acidimicrobiales bacterium]